MAGVVRRRSLQRPSFGSVHQLCPARAFTIKLVQRTFAEGLCTFAGIPEHCGQPARDFVHANERLAGAVSK